MNKWQTGLLQTLLETGAGYTIQREVIHTQTKGGNINTTQREVIIIHTYRQQEVIRYTHTQTKGGNTQNRISHWIKLSHAIQYTQEYTQGVNL